MLASDSGSNFVKFDVLFLSVMIICPVWHYQRQFLEGKAVDGVRKFIETLPVEEMMSFYHAFYFILRVSSLRLENLLISRASYL